MSAEEIAHAFYTTTEAGKAILKDLEAPFAPEGDVDDSALAKTRWVPGRTAGRHARRGQAGE